MFLLNDPGPWKDYTRKHPGKSIEAIRQQYLAEQLMYFQSMEQIINQAKAQGASQVPTTVATEPQPPVIPALLMGIIYSLPYDITDPNDVSQWNTLFGGSTFTSVTVSESSYTNPADPETPVLQYDIALYGSGPFTLTGFEFFSSPTLTYFEDNIGCITVMEQYAIASESNLTKLVLKGLTSFDYQLANVGNGNPPGTPMVLSLPSITTLGPTVGNDDIFINSFGGGNLTLTVPASLMTCNGGNPDGDIQYLQANNTVTVVTV